TGRPGHPGDIPSNAAFDRLSLLSGRLVAGTRPPGSLTNGFVHLERSCHASGPVNDSVIWHRLPSPLNRLDQHLSSSIHRAIEPTRVADWLSTTSQGENLGTEFYPSTFLAPIFTVIVYLFYNTN